MVINRKKSKNKRCLISILGQLSDLFEYKIVSDLDKNDYVLLKSSNINYIDDIIDDKTAFEALENHTHLLDDIKKSEYAELTEIGKKLGRAMLNNLKANFQNKKFIVFVTLSDSMIIRFHQQWENEPEYFTVDDNSDDIVLRFAD